MKKLKLNELNAQDRLNSKEMAEVNGGANGICWCTCSCCCCGDDCRCCDKADNKKASDRCDDKCGDQLM